MKRFISWSTASCLLAAAVSVAWANLNAMQDQDPFGSNRNPLTSTRDGGGAPAQDDQPFATSNATAPSSELDLYYDQRAQAPGFGQTIAGQQSNLAPTQAWLRAYYSASAPQNDELNTALATWKNSANDAAARQTAKEKANQVLGTIYDELLNGQEQEIDALEKRVVELRDQLGRRREAKRRMVELKLEMLLSQTDGLGWPSPETSSPLTRYHDPARESGVDATWTPATGTLPQPSH